MNYLIFFGGVFVGTCLGILIISLCCMAGRGSREEEVRNEPHL
jgi:hypothetical protein